MSYRESGVEYEEHQRDYTLLGNSATFTFCVDAKLGQYFGYQAHPMYVCKKDGLFFHYYASVDKEGRARSWAQKFDIDELRRLWMQVSTCLPDIKDTVNRIYSDPAQGLKCIYEAYREVLPLSLVTTEVPEYVEVNQEFVELCFEIRKATEFVFRDGETLGKQLVARIESEDDVPKGTIENLTYREFLTYCTDKTVPDNVLNRNDFVLIKIMSDSDEVIFDRSAVNSIVQKHDEHVTMLTGMIACSGCVTGTVKVLRTIDEIEKVSEGDIFVASMTDPRCVPAMKKAVAFVTDEGGITCHAAIVARELKKPCIVGTKNATKVLADGDVVEVDANTGTVRILVKHSDKK